MAVEERSINLIEESQKQLEVTKKVERDCKLLLSKILKAIEQEDFNIDQILQFRI